MSYIAFDLDALNVTPAVARAAGIGENDVIAGLTRLWAWCFREETDVVSAIQVRGHFGSDCTEALAAFGFLEAQTGGFRVRGAARYLRVKSAQRAAAVATNQRRSSKRSTDAQSNGEATPYTEHRTPTTDDRSPTTYVAPPGPQVAGLIEAPDGDPEAWSGEQFWCWAQSIRAKSRMTQERPLHPSKLGSWWSVARTAAAVSALKEAYYRFGDDKFWQAKTPPCPFGGFMSQWDRFVPAGGAHVRA